MEQLFISWSGTRSQQLAGALSAWLRNRFSVETFISTSIEKGSLWLAKVQQELGDAKAGIVCLTPASLDSEWMLFEAGALACQVGARKGQALFTYLHGVQPAELSGPLQAYQSTVTTKDDTYQMLTRLLPIFEREQPSPKDFDKDWKVLENALNAIKPETVTSVVPRLADCFDRKTFREKTHECVDRSWFARLKGTTETWDVLHARLDLVKAECGPATYQLFQDLLGEIDGYAMNMRSVLFTENRFGQLTDEGRVDLPMGPRIALEKRRTTIHRLAAQLTDERQHPMLDDTVRFDKATCFAERKALIHRLEHILDAGGRSAKRIREQIKALLTSDWAFERVIGCVVAERGEAGQDASPTTAVDRELELVRARTEESSLIPLYYSLRWLRTDLERNGVDRALAVRSAGAVRRYVDEHELDTANRIRLILDDIDAKLDQQTEAAHPSPT